MDIFWNLFEKSGSIEAYLGFKEFQKAQGRQFQSSKKQLITGAKGLQMESDRNGNCPS